MSFTAQKDPQEAIDYAIDWQEWLADGDTITSSTWTVIGGLTKDAEGTEDTRTMVKVSGGAVGTFGQAKNTIQTSNGDIYERTIEIYVHQR